MTAAASPLVLVVEDDTTIADVQIHHLQAAGMRVHHLARGDAVEAFVRATPPDLVILDVMLPGLDGTDVCRALRRFSHVPVIMVTSRCHEADRLLGFDVGADDYIAKPFSPRELVARARVALRRGHAPPPATAPRPALVQWDAARERVVCAGQVMDLTPHEYRLLTVMLSQPGRIFSRAALLERSYDDPGGVFERAVDSHVKNLRRKLAALLPTHSFIHSVYALGYRYEPIENSASAPPPSPSPAGVVEISSDLRTRLPGFMASRHEALAELKQALAAEQREVVVRIAHRLAGSFALYGFKDAARACHRIEAEGASAPRHRLEVWLDKLSLHLAKVQVRFVDVETDFGLLD